MFGAREKTEKKNNKKDGRDLIELEENERLCQNGHDQIGCGRLNGGNNAGDVRT